MFQGDITSIEDFRLSGIRLMWFFIVHHMECLEENKLECCTYWVNGRARIKYIWLQVVDSLMCSARSVFRVLWLCLFQISWLRMFNWMNLTQLKLIFLDWNPVQSMNQYCFLLSASETGISGYMMVHVV